MDEGNVYGSGLVSEDWLALRDAISPFLHADYPARVEMPQGLPARLREHPLVGLVREYRETGEDKYLDQAGQLLVPTGQPVAWYLERFTIGVRTDRDGCPIPPRRGDR
jgi:hypothetical protein